MMTDLITKIVGIDPDQIDYERTEQEAIKARRFKPGVTVEMLDEWMSNAQQAARDAEASTSRYWEQCLLVEGLLLGKARPIFEAIVKGYLDDGSFLSGDDALIEKIEEVLALMREVTPV
jgi:hypothetical protein